MTLYDLGMHFDIRPGDIFFFRSRRIIHGNQPVVKGIRNSLVFFMHEIGVSDYFKRIGQPSRAKQADKRNAANKAIQKKRRANRQQVAKDLKTQNTLLKNRVKGQARDRDLRHKLRTKSKLINKYVYM